MKTPSARTQAFLQGTKQLLIGGEWGDAADRTTRDSINPADEQVLATFAAGGVVDVDRAVAAARRAFDGEWGATTPADRGKLLWRVGDLILEHADEIAELEALDTGKPLSLARLEVASAAGHWHYYAGWADKIEGTTGEISAAIPGARFQRYSLRKPLGVVGLIVPWNFPLNEASYKMAPALAAGNSIILKPAELTSLSALRLGELIAEAGLPGGAVNIVTGPGRVAGSALAAHPNVDKISFTGSTEVGRHVLAAAGGNMKKVTLELGGKNPGIIFADADLDTAIPSAARAAFANSGQVCTAASRLYVQRPVFDQVVEGMAHAAKSFKLGNGFDPDAELGPLVSERQLQHVSSYVEIGRKEGATLITGGEVTRPGYFITPAVFTADDPSLRIVREEIFGPIVVILPFDTTEEVIAAANDSEYGLSAGVWTSNSSTAARMAEDLDAGVVWINTFMVVDSSVSVGGTKQSGVGYDMGPEAIYGFTHLKAVVNAI
ncbi:aldehyde dehydrogenase family protein [Streptomyces sp. NPDC051219]|uniref:aldehyde dehydrogenase family protein n=1 Tax=Streptomyces sp. NPDC051219 TaxID=3155283 RepID=UPI003425038B